jgi:hypothetical protein
MAYFRDSKCMRLDHNILNRKLPDVKSGHHKPRKKFKIRIIVKHRHLNNFSGAMTATNYMNVCVLIFIHWAAMTAKLPARF